ncbi:MAG: penicillin-binding protein 2 [Candidatus Gastranaerophilales bacterium]|nr:penicillin-binding protein 2 [Candidatus Gastranaerophilales bacterium]
MNDKAKRFKTFDKRLGCWHGLFAIFAVVLIIYLFLIQIMDIKNYRLRAKRQRSSRNFIMRGDIFDRNGIKLASDKIYYDVYAHPTDYDHSPEELAKILAPYLKISKANLVEKLSGQDAVITLKKDLDRETAQKIKNLGLREISLGKKNTRIYPQGSMASHILGYYNFDADIASGVELTAKSQLEHVEKNVQTERTPDGNIIYSFSTDPVATTKPLKGKSLTLTIDTAIQHICEQELYKMVLKRQALRGTVIVMNPKNGEILAYAIYPYYDPNNYKNASPVQIKNWTLTDVFPPGSTFKIITVASAMALGKINLNTKILDTGKIKVGWWDIKNYDYSKKPYPGWINLEYLFEHSSNVGSIKVAQTMSSQEYYHMLKRFGIGSKTGIDLPGESIGLLPSWTKWDSSTHASMGYGYGASVTAIQMVSAASAFANNGVRVTPHIIKYHEEEAQNKIFKTQVMSPETARNITSLLVASVNNSKAPIKLDSYKVAAKTGTSKKPKENAAGYSNMLYTSIIGYLPASDPQVLIYVLVDSAGGGDVWGSTIAAPVFKEIANQTARILNLKPDKR